MTPQEEAAKKWSQKGDKVLIHSNPSLAYLEGISDFKAGSQSKTGREEKGINPREEKSLHNRL